MQRGKSSIIGSRLAVGITSVLVTAVVISGGVAFAGVPVNSVNSSKIVNGTIRSVDLRNGAVTSAKIANGSVTSADLANSAQVVAESETGANLNLSGNGGNQIVETVNINAPGAGQLLITGSFRPDATVTDTYGCAILVDAALDTASSRQVQAEAAVENDCSTNTGVDVAAGPHTVELQSSGTDASNDIMHTSLQVIFVPNL